MADKKVVSEVTVTAQAANAILPTIKTVDDQVARRTEEEIENVIDGVLKPYLRETIPTLMRKLNHQGVFEKMVKMRLEEWLKETLNEYAEEQGAEVIAKIDRKFREVILAEFEPRIEQAAKKLLDDRLAKLRQEFGK